MIEITMDMKPNYIDTAIKKVAVFFKKEESVTSETFLYRLNPIKENLYNFIFKALYFSEDADDVYQETVLRAFKYRNSFNPGASFKTWLFTIANNEIKSYFNKTKKFPGTHCREMEENLYVPDDTINEKSLVLDIYEVAMQLTPRQREIFFLFYDQQFSMKEIVEITDLKEGNIKFILNQAREKIKQKLFDRSKK